MDLCRRKLSIKSTCLSIFLTRFGKSTPAKDLDPRKESKRQQKSRNTYAYVNEPPQIVQSQTYPVNINIHRLCTKKARRI
ncbi:hypothetical protein EUGRSUZ_K02449 [Eucalyptus grandis]|uniref:Uncharacterized protein n=2 Tax=Eucalyptus grandis TaxID=71139 RepID=A0ACC3IXI4_EUCGR|nr:hypothetical protein EUGRSUZ_K02449 [Eucalyptus grandis]